MKHKHHHHSRHFHNKTLFSTPIFLSVAIIICLIVTTKILTKQKNNQKVDSPQEELNISSPLSERGNDNSILKKKDSVPMNTEPLSFRQAYIGWDNNIILDFNTDNESLDFKTLKGITVTPHVSFDSSINCSEVSLEGSFKPGMQYKIRIPAGLATKSGKRKLENDIIIPVKMNDLYPNIDFLSEGNYYPLKNETFEFPCSISNISIVNIAVYRSFDVNFFFDFSSGNQYEFFYQSIERMEKIGEKDVSFNFPKNIKSNQLLSVDDILPKDKRKAGIYAVVVTPKVISSELNLCEQYYGEEHRQAQFFVLTDFAISMVSDQLNKTGISLLVKRISDDTPVSGADITVFSRKNQIAARGKTNRDGLLNMQFLPEWNSKDDDVAAVKVILGDEQGFYPVSLNRMDDAIESLSHPRAFVFMERGVCRPGEKFMVSSFIREWKDFQYVPLRNAPVTLSILNPMGTTFATYSFKTDSFGFLTTEISLPKNAATGYYTCSVGLNKTSWGTNKIYVNHYVPDHIKLDLNHDESHAYFTLNNEIKFTGTAKYYFGSPVDNAVWRIKTSANAARKPNHWKDWSVGKLHDSYVNFQSQKKEKNVSQISFIWKGENGSIECTSPVKLNLECDVQEPGGRTVTSNDSVLIYPTDHFYGIKTKSENGKLKLTVGLLGIEPNDSFKTPKDEKLSVRIFRKEWDYNLVKSEGNRYRREWKERLTPLKDFDYSINVPVNSASGVWSNENSFELSNGNFLIEVVSNENPQFILSQHEFWHYAGQTGVRSGDPSLLTFDTNSNEYQPGSEAELSFVSSFPGSAFFVCGENGIETQFVQPVDIGKNRVKIKIPEKVESGSYFVECIVIGKNANRNYVRLKGLASLSVSQSNKHKMNVFLDIAQKVQPNTTIPCKMSVSNQMGMPQEAKVLLFAVDSGVLSLSGYHAPDIFSYFFGQKNCPFGTYEMYGELFPNLKILPDGTVAGDAAYVGAARNIKTKDVARLIAPPVIVPASGKMEIPLSIPAHTGEMTVIAVASNDQYVGCAEKEIIVRNPVSIIISAPRAVAIGDQFNLSIRAFNHEIEGKNAELFVDWEGTEQKIKSILLEDLQKDSQKFFSIPVTATKNGVFPVKVTLVMNDQRYTDTEYITVRSTIVPQTVSQNFVVEAGKNISISIPKDVDSQSVKVLLSSSPITCVANAIDWLNQYPYGCLEQITAKAFPFLALNNLVKSGILSQEEANAYQYRVPETYKALLAMQNRDGSFSMWPWENKTWLEGTLFADHFIFAAKNEKLISPDKELLKGIQNYLRSVANDMANTRQARAYAAYILSLAEDAGAIIPARNLISTNTTDFAAFLAGAALIHGKYASEGAPVVMNTLKHPQLLSSNEEFPGFSSYSSKLGMILHVLSEVGISDAHQFMTEIAFKLSGLVRNDASVWGTTQSNAWVTYGLASFNQVFPSSEFTSTISYQNGKKISIHGKQVQEIPFDSSAFTISNTGDSTLFAQISYRGISSETIQDTANGITLSRSYFDDKGLPLEKVVSGDLVYVKVSMNVLVEELKNFVVVDMLPGGFEIEDEMLASRSHDDIPKAFSNLNSCMSGIRSSKEDDRMIFFASHVWKGKHDFLYRVRAVHPGVYKLPQAHAEAMYNLDVSGNYSPDGVILIE